MRENISVLVVEDETIWAKQLQASLGNLGFTIAGIFDDVTEAMAQLPTLSFDIALLDIQMHGKNIGIELGRIIGAIYHKPFIFITDDDKKSTRDAVMAKPSAYLIKPLGDTALFVAIQTALYNHDQQQVPITESINNQESFFIKMGTRYKKVAWAGVTALSVAGRYTKVQLNNDAGEYLIGNSLSKIISNIVPPLLKASFVQVNRNELVNVQHIEELNGNLVKTKMHNFQLTEHYGKSLRSRLNIVK